MEYMPKKIVKYIDDFILEFVIQKVKLISLVMTWMIKNTRLALVNKFHISTLLKKIKIIFIFAILCLFISCFNFIPCLLMFIMLSPNDKILETDFASQKINNLIQIPACAKNINGIVVLGAGTTYAESPGHYSLMRLLGFINLLNLSPDTILWKNQKTPIIFSGGFTNKSNKQSEAQVLKKYAFFIYGKKMSEFNVITENTSKNTYENALYSKEIFNKKQLKKNIILITNSYHMQRSLSTFKTQGFQVCPISVSSNDIFTGEFFSLQNVLKTNILLHEYLGIIWYLAKGWIK